MADMLVSLHETPDARAGMAALAERGIVCRRAESFERIAILEFVRERWPNWLDHAAAAFSHVPPRMSIALYQGVPGGFVCWDAMRPGIIGPIAVVPEARGLGAGSTLMAMALDALAHHGYAYAVVARAGAAAGFFERAAGAMIIPGSGGAAPAEEAAA